MAKLTAAQRRALPDSAFAYIDSQGKRRLPIHDETRVRNALARFDRTDFESPDARERARTRLLNAAKKYGIVPVGFITAQLETERVQGQIEGRRADLTSLPSGRLTLLFTDIEGSTPHLHRLESRYADVLASVRTIIATAISGHRGHEVEMRADETFSVYPDPEDALSAALSIQRSMAAASWPGGTPVKVRIGLHTGETQMTDAGYVGLAVNTASRVCNAGHGGQILVSSATRDAVRDAFSFRSLGEFSLAGLRNATEILQLEAPDLAAEFPDLRV